MSVWARSGNTSNLFSHLKNNHKTTFALVKAAKSNEGKSSHLSNEQPTIVSALEGAQPYTHSSKKWKELTDSVMHFIVKDCLPIHSVEKEGFKAMIHKFDSRYDLLTPSEQPFLSCILLQKIKLQNNYPMLNVFLQQLICGPA